MTSNESGQQPLEVGPQSEPSSIPVRKLIMGLVGVAVAVAVGLFGWNQYATHQQAEKTNQISAEVRQEMQARIDSHPEYAKYKLQIDEVALIKESETKYSGMMTIHSTITQRQIPVEVTSDGTKTMWQFDESTKSAFSSLLGQ
jgi:hypothetical protein